MLNKTCVMLMITVQYHTVQYSAIQYTLYSNTIMKGVIVDKKLTKSWKSAKSLIDLADVRIFPKLQWSEVLQTDGGSGDKLRNILNYVNTHKIHETRGRL